MTPDVMTNVLHVLLICCAVPATVFVILYATTAYWWKSHTGRALFTSSVALALLLDITLLTRFADLFDMKMWFWIQTFLLFYTAAALWYLLAVLAVTVYFRWKSVARRRGYDLDDQG